ncbi:FtsX-like permease family protein [Ligilactobacillus acidipiscis]|uniref:FtsX-like permease family protein n=3 Tax=Ligilactobacillus acidipiscis TaxID=89059 RepID=UPI003865A3C9
MLRKLAFTGIKSRLRDYLVLFTGLVISSAVFYMFEALATNPQFLKNSTNGMSAASFIFQFGSVLLTIISLVYIFYANSFLLSMRQHDYGIFMMLGAKPTKIGRLILTETLVIGALSSVIGVVVGCLLTASLGSYLMQSILQTNVANFHAVHVPAILVTLVLYLVLFVIAGFINRRKLIKTPVLGLLKGDSQPNRAKLKPVSQFIQVVLGIGLLAVGYYVMKHFIDFQLASIPLALVTIVFGSYFLFNAVFVWLVVLLKKTKWAQRGINNFTLSQLDFRIRNYTKILATVSILFALALGAITVGMGFGKETDLFTQGSSGYTMALEDPSAAVKKQVNKLDTEKKVSYSEKQSKDTVYYVKEEFDRIPLQDVSDNWMKKMSKGKKAKISYQSFDGQKLQKNPGSLYYLQKNGSDKTVKIISQSEFAKIQAPRQQLYLFRVKNIEKSKKSLDKIVKTAYPKNYETIRSTIPGGYAGYLNGLEVFGGFEFMGFFLGIAFLAMLASCLMFKILSGANSDKHRYEMLNKLGVRKNTLRRSISREIMTLYALPGVLGIVHVLFGLQLFKTLLISPYQGIWLPFVIFIVLYLLYYLVTVKLYESIVLPAVEIDK